jgi:DNA-3-methyladenine glycosylase I
LNTRAHPDGLTRCSWVTDDPTYLQYHDEEWGNPNRGQQQLFEAICLEGFQAGLSWITILSRREGFRKAFHNFEITKVAAMGHQEIDLLMQDPGIIRNRAKIQSTIKNAGIVLDKKINLVELIWKHESQTKTKTAAEFEFRSESPESKALSKELKSLGFSFVGPTTMYALMQSSGVVKDHAPDCFRSA